MSNRTHIVDVSGRQVQETMERLGDRVVRAIFLVEDTVNSSIEITAAPKEDIEALMAEMDALAVHAGGHVDDSREAIYTRLEGE